MNLEGSKTLKILAGLILVHFVVTLVHGWAHMAAGVQIGRAALGFVVVVIVAGPLLGLAWIRRSIPIGLGLIAATMIAALVFGLVNHFVLASADRVDHVAPPWRPWFEATAALLAITEAAAAVLSIRQLLFARTRTFAEARSAEIPRDLT